LRRNHGHIEQISKQAMDDDDEIIRRRRRRRRREKGVLNLEFIL
jgi:hypothetical protein